MTTWNEIPSGDLTAAVSNLLKELGEDAELVLKRMQTDPAYTREVKNFAVERAGGRPNKPRRGPIKNQVTMSAVKRLMGSRCFTAHETAVYLDMPREEECLIPKIPSRELRKLIRFLQGPCPFIPDRKAVETHVLFPVPEIVQGCTTDLLTTRNLLVSWRGTEKRAHIMSIDQTCTFGWHLACLSPDGNFAPEKDGQILPHGYNPTHITPLLWQFGLWRKRVLTTGCSIRTDIVAITSTTGLDTVNRTGRIVMEIGGDRIPVVRLEQVEHSDWKYGIAASRLIPTC